MSWVLPNAVFIHIPKTAGISIGRLLAEGLEVERYEHHLTALETRPLVPNWNKAFKFTVIRNPWARMVSMYLMDSKARFIDYLSHPTARGSFGRNFPLTQTDFICDKQGQLMVDYVARFEKLEEEWRYISGRLDLPRVLPHTNQGPVVDYREFYTTETREIVQKKYAQEIAMFEYEF